MASTSNNPGISNAAATSKALTHELFFEYAYRNVIGEKQLRLLVNDMVTDNPGVQLPSARDVKQLLKFLDKDGNGTIDENEFTTWLADGANRSEQSKEKIRQTGNPTQVRFVNFLDAVLHWLQPSEDRIREIFDASNYEHDGHMSMEDLKELVEKTHQLPISNRLGELPSTEQDFKRLMELIDEDHSGTIERQEFMHWLKKGIALMRALDGKQRVQYALKDPFHIKLINMYEALVDNWTTASKITHAFPAGPLGLTFNQQTENGENVVHVLSIKPKSSASDVRRILRSIHRISSIANVGSDDIDRLKALKKERQIHVLKRTRTMLLGEYENERAEVVLRKALPSRRVMKASTKKATKGGGKKNDNGKTTAVSMGSHHSTVVPGYSYSPRNNMQQQQMMNSNNNNSMPPPRHQANNTYPPMGMNNGYFGVSPQIQQQQQQQRQIRRGGGGGRNGNQPFSGAVYYNEGSPIAVFAGQEAQRSFPQYYNNNRG